METENRKPSPAEQLFAEFNTTHVNMLPFEQLAEGWHKVKVKICIITSDIFKTLRNPVRKTAEELAAIPWMDSTPQLGVYFEGDNHKGCTRRFSLIGYWKFDNLLTSAPDEAAKCTKEGDAGYAVYKDSKVRIKSKKETDAAQMIMNRMLTAAGVPEGTPGTELPKALIERELFIQVTKHTYKDKEYFDVANFLSLDTPESEFSRVPLPKNAVAEIPATE